jgi:hypothetical protein
MPRTTIAGEPEHDRPIGRQEYAIGHDLRGSVARTARRTSIGNILREDAVPPEKRGLHQRSIYSTPLARLHAIAQRREDRYRCPHPGIGSETETMLASSCSMKDAAEMQISASSACFADSEGVVEMVSFMG